MTLEWSVVAAVLLSALLHASWNAVAKASSDPLVNVALVNTTGGVVGIALAPFLPFPEPEAWPFLAATALVHGIYGLALVRAYSLGDLSQVYPIARGLAPLGVAALALLAGEVPTPRQGLGLLVACAAIASLADLHRHAPAAGAAVRTACGVALLISTYTVIDGLGARACANPWSYVVWMFVVDTVPLLGAAVWLRGGSTVLAFVRSEGRQALGAGLMATVGYSLVVWALYRGAMAPIAALRETSVIAAAAIGARVLGEPFGGRRVLAASALVAGLALVHL